VIGRLRAARRAIGVALLVPGLLMAGLAVSPAASQPLKLPPKVASSREHRQHASRSGNEPRTDRCVYVVRRGDSLSRIAAQHRVTRGSIVAANHLTDVDQLRVGQRLEIAGCKAAPARRAPERGRALAAADGPELLARVGPGRIPTRLFLAVPDFTGEGHEFRWPIEGPVVSGFGRRAAGWHAGVDIQGEMGTPFRAAAGGTVAFSGWEGSYGRVIVILHADGFRSIYAHNLENLVETGDEVEAGTVIGTVGRSGHASGAHLHFEIRRDGTAYNPLHLLEAREGPVPTSLAVATVDLDDEYGE